MLHRLPFGSWFDGAGIIELVVLLAVIAFWILVIIGLVYLVRWLIRADRNSRLPGGPGAPGTGPGPGAPGSPGPNDPLEILQQRYARGEIDDEEYERRRKTLTGA